MPRTTTTSRQSKEEKAIYDKKRKAEARKERKFTKPMKLFFKAKYPAQYAEFKKFFNQLEITYPGKKDFTKTSMFREFLTNYPIEEKSTMMENTMESCPILSSLLESSEAESQASTSSSHAIVEAPSTSSHIQARDIISELVDELFGHGDLDQYIDHVENADEGIDVNIFDELKLDWEPFDFELEALDF